MLKKNTFIPVLKNQDGLTIETYNKTMDIEIEDANRELYAIRSLREEELRILYEHLKEIFEGE